MPLLTGASGAIERRPEAAPQGGLVPIETHKIYWLVIRRLFGGFGGTAGACVTVTV
jgi:hypothetical protein